MYAEIITFRNTSKNFNKLENLILGITECVLIFTNDAYLIPCNILGMTRASKNINLQNHWDKYIVVQDATYRNNDGNNVNIQKLFPTLEVTQLLWMPCMHQNPSKSCCC